MAQEQKVWGIVGDRSQSYQPTQPSPDHVEMQSPKPIIEGQDYQAKADGTWEVATLTPEEAKMKGVEFEGVFCSATANDMFGLKCIEDEVAAGIDVNFHFENGSTLVLTQANITAFKAVWVAFRYSFFPLPE